MDTARCARSLQGIGRVKRPRTPATPSSQVVRELMREFIERQQQAREYDAFLRTKADAARGQIASGQVADDTDVEARFAARSAAQRAKAGFTGP